MILLTKEVKKALPPLMTMSSVADPLVVVKFFQPWGAWTWFAYEGSAVKADGTEVALKDMGELSEYEDVSFFGWVKGHGGELGYFSLRELMAIRGPAGLGIERDRGFRPTPLSEIKEKYA